MVAAGEAYLADTPEFRRTLIPMSSMIVLTAPLTESQWAQIGWAQGEGLSSCSPLKPYLTKTIDGRLLFGSRGAPYRFGSRMSESMLGDEAAYAPLRAKAREWFPVLEDVPFTHAWGGFLGVPRDWMPIASYDSDRKFARLCG